MFSPGSNFAALDLLQQKAATPHLLLLPLNEPAHAQWQAQVRDGQLVEAMKTARSLGLDLTQAYALVNEYRAQEGLLPPRQRRWWWPFGNGRSLTRGDIPTLIARLESGRL